MRCEVCGQEIRGQPLRRVIEGAKMTVCARCAHFGTADWIPTRPQVPQRSQRPRNEVEAVERLELVDGYGEMIRKARQRMGMTVEDLGTKIREKESVIKKLEKEELAPDRKLVQKLRNALKIELMEAGETTAVPTASRPTSGRTLGDIIKLKQAGKEPSEDEEEAERR